MIFTIIKLTVSSYDNKALAYTSAVEVGLKNLQASTKQCGQRHTSNVWQHVEELDTGFENSRF